MKARKVYLFYFLIIGLFFSASLGFISSSVQAQENIRIFFDGREIVPQDQPPVIINDRTLVPIRAISEGMGMEVKWDAENYRVLISKSETSTAVQVPLAPKSDLMRIYLDGREIKSEDAPPIIINARTMVPIRAISEGMGLEVKWDADNYMVLIMSEPVVSVTVPISNINEVEEVTQDKIIKADMNIMGESVATAEQLRALLRQSNPLAPDLAELYLQIGREYGIRGDIAFCQAAKETGWWKYGGLAVPEQNNYCGLSVTGRISTADEDLRGANPNKVWFIEGTHGAYFDCPASGVEAHIQHLYAYATDKPLPSGKDLLDPRFVLVKRGCAPQWIDLGGKWAVPGYDRNKYSSLGEAFAAADTYGHSILSNYYNKALLIK